MGVLPDFMIESEVKIEPFSPCEKRPGKISYGLTSYGYDARLGYRFRVMTPHRCTAAVIDPKKDDPSAWTEIDLTPPTEHDWEAFDHGGKPYIRCRHCQVFEDNPYVKDWDAKCFATRNPDYLPIPPGGFVLGETLETFTIPRDVLCLVMGKSTYARVGIQIYVTPGEPCVSEDTEILTRQGWRLVKDVLIGQEVLTRREDGRAEYQPIQRKQKNWFRGNMLEFSNKLVNQRVTPDHKLFVWRPRGRIENRTWASELLPAEEVFGHHNFQFDRQVDWRGESDPDFLEVAGRRYPAGDFLYFLGCWLGDGSAFVREGGNYVIKLAVVTKEKKRAAFADALNALGIKASLHERGFHWLDKVLCLWLRNLGKARTKFVPREFMSLSPRLLHRLLDGLMTSDGTWDTMYTTVSKQLADDVQELMYKCGYSAIIRENPLDEFDGRPTDRVVYKIRKNTRSPITKIPPEYHKTVEHEGWVYDVTVPNHVFLSRRLGKPSWTGNCWTGKWTVEISNTGPLPVKVYPGEGIMQCVFLRSDAQAAYALAALRDAAGATDFGLHAKLLEATQASCRTSYADKKGKYSNQQGLTPAKVE